MAANTLSENITLAIKNADGSSFYNLSLKKFTVDSQVMSLGDKITGDVYYKDNNLPFTMREYVEYDGVKYTLVNPPTVVKEGMVRDNSENKGMTKYSLEFYHPMYQLGNMPFNDVAVSYNESSYMSESATFSWVGYPDDYIAKLNKNLQGTQWIVVKSSNFPSSVESQISEVLAFDKESIADALKKMYETWELPYIVDKVGASESSYAQGKRFKVIVGMPSSEIYEQGSQDPFVFQYGQGVGLKNNSRSPRNNKIITRIAGYGSERNIPYGYPQIVWTGSTSDSRLQYPLYDGIVGGQPVKLIKHPFTRKTLMPSIYVETVYNKVNPLLPNGSTNPNYNPNAEIIEYYDATAAENYPNPINPLAPSYETHEFEDIYPRLGSASIVGVVPSNKDAKTYVPFDQIDDVIDKYIDNSSSYPEKDFLWECKGMVITTGMEEINYDKNVDTHSFVFTLTHDDTFLYLEYKSNDLQNFKFTALRYGVAPPTPAWDDTMDDKGEYTQSYMEITLPVLGFDIYACASITEQMQINMRSGACIGCTFDVAVDWDDYKKNFFNADGDFVPDGAQRDLVKYPKSNVQSITVTAKKDLETFGTLMPNRYQKPQAGDEFVILGISLPLSYIQSAEAELADAAKAYMRENNIYYFDYPLKFDEFFLRNNDHILSQIKPNAIVHFNYAGDTKDLYIKQLTTKVGYAPLPQFDITLTDNIEVSLNQIGQTVDELGKLSDVVALLRRQTSDGLLAAVMSKLSKTDDDTANGLIRFMKGLQIGRSFSSGILGSGGIIGVNPDGSTYLEVDEIYARMKAIFDNVEVKNYQHSVGNRMVTKAGIKCSRVEWVDENGEYVEQNQANLSSVVSFRCFYRAKDTDDTVNNDFVAGVNEEDGKGTQDLAFCDSTNIASGVNKRSYWRAVVGKNANGTFTLDGEGWIDLSKADCLANSDIPMAGDDIIQLGNVTDKDRQGAIVEYIGGNDAPCYKIYQEIGLDERTDEEREQDPPVPFNPYVLTDKCFIDFGYSRTTKRAYMNVYGDMYVGTKAGETNSTYIRYTQPHKEWVTPAPTEEVPEPEPELVTIPAKLEIKAIIDAQSTLSGTGDKTLAQIFQGIQQQLDGAIDTWFYDYMPVAADQSGAPDGTVPLIWRDENHTIPCEPYYNWYTADNGGTEQETKTERIKHLGDIFYDNKTGYAFRFSNTGTEANPTFAWVEITDSAVIKALADAAKAQETADHKSTIFLNNPEDQDTSKRYPTGYKKGDSWILPSGSGEVNISNTATERKFKKGSIITATADMATSYNPLDWNEKVRYTDDTKFNNYLTQVLNGVQNPQSDSEVVAQAMHVLKSALQENTTIDGGLILTSFISLRKNGTVWSGISGLIEDTETGEGFKGYGIASWYGGGHIDHEVTPSASGYAKSLFRFDGSGYLASGNITWDANGTVTIKDLHTDDGNVSVNILNEMSAFRSMFDLSLWSSTSRIHPLQNFDQIRITHASGYTFTDNDVLNRAENDARYLLMQRFFDLFDVYNGSTNYTETFKTSGLPSSTANISIKAKFGLWTEQYLSALGQNSQGSGGGVDMDTVWTALANNTNEQINATHLSTALTGYATQDWVQLQGYITSYTDTKNTSGSTNLANTKLFIIGAQTQGANPQTYSYVNAYIGTDGCLYSNGSKVLTSYTEQYTGTVTSVAMTVPTGFSVSGTPITTSGTFALTYATGYEGFTTSLKDKINLLYSLFTREGSGTTADPYVIKANYGLYTDQFLSALGLNSSGSSGGATVLSDLTDVEYSGTPSNGQVLKYNSSTGKWYNGDDNNTGTVTSIKVGTTSYSPVSGVVSLPAYPTTLPASDVYSWAKASTKPSYTLDEIFDGTTRKLSNYLPLSGGTMTGTLTLKTSTYAGQLVIWRDHSANDAVIAFKNNSAELGCFGFDGYKRPYISIDSGNTVSYIIHSGNIGAQSVNYATTAGSATALTTARLLWGNSFDGTADINNDIKLPNNKSIRFARVMTTTPADSDYWNVLTLNASNQLALGYYNRTHNAETSIQGGTITLNVNGGQGSATSAVDNAVQAISILSDGQVYLPQGAKGLRIGNGLLVWDSTNNAIKVVSYDGSTAVNFYATGAVSALGANTSGSGGGGSSTLAGLTDVSVGSQTQGQVLGWDGQSHWVPMNMPSTSNFVTLNSTQTITGQKTFTSAVTAQSLWSDSVWANGAFSVYDYTTDFAVLSSSGSHVGIGTAADTNYTLKVGGNTKVNGSITLSGSSVVATLSVNSNSRFNDGTGVFAYTSEIPSVSVPQTTPVLSWGNSSVLATIGSTNISVSMPSNPVTYGTTAGTAAEGNHTHGLSISPLVPQGSTIVELSANTSYTLTAGGSTIYFKTPQGTTISNYITTDTDQNNLGGAKTWTQNASGQAIVYGNVSTKIEYTGITFSAKALGVSGTSTYTLAADTTGLKIGSNYIYHDGNLRYGLENLAVGLVQGGQTTVSGDTITTSGVNADTYFFINLTEAIDPKQIYTLGFYVSGVPSGTTFNWSFGIGDQFNTSWVVKITGNGWVWATGKYAAATSSTTRIILDDDGTGTRTNILTFSKFVLVKGTACPYYTAPISKMSVANADTVDGYDASSFLILSEGGVVLGSLTASNNLTVKGNLYITNTMNTAAMSLVASGDNAGRIQVGSGNVLAYKSELASYLPLIGGTITSNSVKVEYSNYNVDINNKRIHFGITSGSSEVIYANLTMEDDITTGLAGSLKIGSNYIIHSGNIGSQSVNYAATAGSATDSTKVALSGDTMTGTLTLKTSTYAGQLVIWRDHSVNDAVIAFKNNSAELGCLGFDGYKRPYISIDSGNTVSYIIHSGNIGDQSVNYATTAGSATDSTKLPLTGGELSGNLTISDKQLILTKSVTISGNPHHTTGSIYAVYDQRNTSYAMYYNAAVDDRTIGTTYHVFGQGLYVNGSVDATSHPTHSDARLKDIQDYYALVSVDTIANAPAIRFHWKDGVDKDLHCGTIAQYWNTVMPECVTRDRNGYLSMQYDVIALLAAISVAKKVVNNEERIAELERENIALRNEINNLKAA